MSTLAYQLRIRTEDDTADALVITSVPSLDYPYLAAVPTGDGQTLSPVEGKVSVGAYTVQVIDAFGTVVLPGQGWLDDPEVDGNGNPTGGFDAEWPLTSAIDGTPTTAPGSLALSDGLLRMTVATNAGVGLIGFAELSRTRVFPGFTPGATYTTQVAVALSGEVSPANQFGMTVNGVAATMTTGNATLTVSAVANGSGELAVTLGLTTDGPGQQPFSATFGYPQFTGPTAGGTGTDGLTDPTTVYGRVVTSSLADFTGRQHLLSRKAYVEETTTDGAFWSVLTVGYVNALRLIDALVYEFTIGESKRIEQSTRLWDRMSDPVAYPDGIGVLDRMSCIVGGPIIGDFGPLPDQGRPRYRVSAVDSETVDGVTRHRVAFQWLHGPVHSVYRETGPPLTEPVVTYLRDVARDYIATDLARYTIGGASAGIQAAPCPNLVLRLYDASSGAWITDQTPRAERLVASVGAFGTSDEWSIMSDTATLLADDWQTGEHVLPSVGDTFLLALFPAETSERNPIHLTGHPVDLYVQAADSKGISYDAASATAVKAALGPDMIVDLRLTAGGPFEDMVTTHLFAPFGFTTRANDQGERELIATRVRPTAVPATVVTEDELTSAEGVVWELDEASAATKVTFESQSLTVTLARENATPIDCIRPSKVTIELVPNDPVTVFGDREIRFTVAGHIRGLDTAPTLVTDAADPGAIGAGSFWLDTTAGLTVESGAILRVRNAANDAWRVWNDTTAGGLFPVVSTATLDTLIRRAGGLDLWAAQQFGPLFDWQGRGAITGEFHVRRDVVTELVGDEIVLDVAHLPTASPLQRPPAQRGTIARRAQILRRTVVPEGLALKVLDRGPAEADDDLDTPSFTGCGDVAAPTGLSATVDGTTVTLTWTVGDAALRVEVSVRETGDDAAVVLQILPPGSTTTTLALPDAGTDYTVAVRHIDAPPLHCASDAVEATLTTDTAATLAAPIDPIAFADGLGTYGMECTATELPSGTEVWEAIETGVGTALPGAFTLGGTVVSVADGRTRYTSASLAANDGMLRFLEARHTRTGWDPSPYTDPVSINPWAVVPPVVPEDPGPVEPALTDVSLPLPFVLEDRAWEGAQFPAAVTAAGTGRQVWLDLGGVGSAVVTATIYESTLPVGAAFAFQYQADDGSWAYLDGVDGPKLLVDPTSVADWEDGVMLGLAVPLVDDARQVRRVRLVTVGGDETGLVTVRCLHLHCQAVSLSPEQPESPESDDPTVEQACDFGNMIAADLTSIAEFNAQWDRNTFGGNVTCNVSLGTEAGEQVVIMEAFGNGGNPNGNHDYYEKDFTGTTSGGTAYLEMVAKLEVTGSDTFAYLYSGIGIEGNLNDNFFGNGPAGSGSYNDPTAWKTFVTETVGSLAGSMHAKVGLLTGDLGETNHGWRWKIRSIKLIEIGCTEFVSVVPGDPGQPGPQPLPPPVGPNPPPDPVVGDSPFITMDAPAGNTDDLAHWNGNILKWLTPSNAASAYASSEAAGMKHFLQIAGPQGYWAPNHIFNLNLWIARVRLMAAVTAIADGIADGTFPACYLIDEPMLAARYGKVISAGELTTMCAVVREIWPSWRIFIRAEPYIYNKVIPGLTGWWAQYHRRKGDPASYLAKNLASATSLGNDAMVAGMNVVFYDGLGARNPNPCGSEYPDRAIVTAAEMARDGVILARNSSPLIFAFAMWRWCATINADAALQSAIQTVGNTFQANRP